MSQSNDHNPLPRSVHEQIDAICTEFEEAWKSGQQPCTQDVLAEIDGVAFPELIRELLILELNYRPKLHGEKLASDASIDAWIIEANQDLMPELKEWLHEARTSEAARGEAMPEMPPMADTVDYIPSDVPENIPIDVPENIGIYPVIAYLDGGGQAEVFLGRLPNLPKEVVIKVSHHKLADIQTDEDRLTKEGHLLAGFEHPNIAGVIDLGVHEEHPFLVMEYVRGRTLSQYAQSREISSQMAATIVAKAARAIAAAHAKGIVHRDIKPDNILIDETNEPIIIDFGMARIQHAWKVDRESPGTVCGSFSYMSPEQARGEVDNVNDRSDIFSLGAVLYWLLVCEAPFKANNSDQALEQAKQCDFDRQALHDSNVSSRLKKICLRAMSPKQEDRHGSADELAADLESWLGRSSVARRFAVGTALLLLVAAVAAWSVITNDSRPDIMVPLTGTIDVLVWDPEDKTRSGLSLDDPGALPLKIGDQVRIVVELNRPAYVYVVWIDSQGEASPVYPWLPGQWTQPAKKVARVMQLALPEEADRGWEMKDGPSGMETLLLLARNTPLPLEFKLEDQLSELPELTNQSSRALIWFADGVPISGPEDFLRAPDFSAPQQIDDSILQVQRLIHEKLSSHFKLMRAVSFSSQGS